MLLPLENLIVFVLGVICEFYSWHCHLGGLLRILWCVGKLFERCHSGIEWRITIMDVLIMSFMLSTPYVKVTSESEHMTITIVWSTVLLFFLDNVSIHYILSMEWAHVVITENVQVSIFRRWDVGLILPGKMKLKIWTRSFDQFWFIPISIHSL